jgi:hypothetical protein
MGESDKSLHIPGLIHLSVPEAFFSGAKQNNVYFFALSFYLFPSCLDKERGEEENATQAMLFQ